MNNRFNGYTGHILEEEILGACTVHVNGYLRFREAMELARKNQPKSLTHEGQRLRHHVAEKLGVAEHEVKLFTAVGSPLDRFHSIDGWFEWQGIIVTVDVTANSQKESYKARVTVQGEDAEHDFALAARDISDQFIWAKRCDRTGVV